MSGPSSDRVDSGLEMPLRPALVKQDAGEESTSPRTGPSKVVSIADPEVSPIIPSLENQTPKQFSAGLAKRLSGRPPSNSSKSSLVSQTSLEELPAAAMEDSPESGHKHHLLHHHKHHAHEKLLTQVSQWLQAEKAKRAARKSNKGQVRPSLLDGSLDNASPRPRTASTGSDGSVASLEKLQRILEDNMTSANFGMESMGDLSDKSPRLAPRRPSSSQQARRKSSILGRAQSSDTEYHDGDVIVPSCDVVLDNSKTLSYAGGLSSTSSADLARMPSRADKERKAWSVFKSEILRLAHTLRLKGWRRIPLDRGDDIEVKRLSGALTNAVYVVSPPSNLATAASTTSISGAASGTSTPSLPKRTPPKLLLRIYGPQVEHLIDRENELGILRRLARKKIGPRLLGTFQNGRFEEYFASTTLTCEDLRVPETSKQIAKRMRELHEGIDLLEREREEGPFVWRNWDKWVERCEEVVRFVDAKAKVSGGHVCGVEWNVFTDMVNKYRSWLADYYGGEHRLAQKLVFAHNDTQYGNILRLLQLTSESPLLLPANTHKQLVVIDFEYASANTPGLEFANHFTEWCYNYHDEQAPHKCHTEWYPTPEEQRRFIRSYVNHRPQFNPRASATPKLGPRGDSAAGSIKEFMLDSRTPGGSTPGGYDVEEERRVKAAEAEVERLVKEAQIWRVANSAQWVAWGIVQAKVRDVDEDDDSPSESKSESPKIHEHHDKRPEGMVAETLLHSDSAADLKDAETAEEEDGEDEFDYLSYARERAMFFWGDCVNLGLCKLEELPDELRESLKIVPY